MNPVVVRYKTHPDRGDENQELVEAVFAELNANDPGGVRDATLRLEDCVTYVHIAIIEADDGSNPLKETAALGAFQDNLLDRCAEPPSPSPATLVGSYGFLAGKR